MLNAAEKARYVLIAPLPRPIEVRIEDTFLGLGGTTKPFMGYHITLLGPFHLAEGFSRDDLGEIEGICRRWRPFEVRIDGLDAFREEDNNTVYLGVSSEGLIALHDALAKALVAKIVYQHPKAATWNLESYRPHVTLGLGLKDEELALVLRDGASRRLEATFEVSALHLMEQEANQPWERVATFPLGREGSTPPAAGAGDPRA